MANHLENIRRVLANGPQSAMQLVDSLGVSRPTITRALGSLEREVIRIGSGNAVQYALRDTARGLEDVPVYRVSAGGTLRCLGHLIATHPGPDALTFVQTDGVTTAYDGLPWWLDDMRPQGYLGRAYARVHGRALGLPEDPKRWSGTHALRALLAHGHDWVGNLLLGDYARERWLALPSPVPVEHHDFPRLAELATQCGDPGSSAGGEQPKFVTYANTPAGARHVIVKFAGTENDVQRRWSMLLVAEHLALETLRDSGVPAAQTWVVDVEGSRFLVAERFDRAGERGRVAMISMAAMDAEFVGRVSGPWPEVAARLRAEGRIVDDAEIQLLWAFGTLIGNVDMHFGNLAFVSEHGQPYQVAPAYDMLPMAFAPRRDGTLPARVSRAKLIPGVPVSVWRRAAGLARDYLNRLRNDARVDTTICDVLDAHLADAEEMLARQD